MGETEAELLGRCPEWDNSAFAGIADAYQNRIYSFGPRLLREPAVCREPDLKYRRKKMKNIKRYALVAAALACLGQTAQARRSQIGHEDVLIEKGQTVNGDVATDKSITVNGVLNGDAVAVGGAQVIVNGEITGDLSAIGGPVAIAGRVNGDVSSVGGPVTISGKVYGYVSSVGGNVELVGPGEVDGDISSLGGSVVKGAGTVHKGEVNSFDMRAVRKVLPRVLRLARYSGNGDGDHGFGPVMAGGLAGLGLMFLFSMLATGAVLMILPAVFFPKNVEHTVAVISGICGAPAVSVRLW
ncbi:MAG: hypothetical protein COX65_08600 [Elusimicrobia bacterium CG_4_10_14_0_2_um_filter_56_8]|nr:MAG: hypothetical protein COX65_08600 [Elusimicrobia bacterium CG_4_10_14_0_2_um_filter_56_8]